jgi:ring-1,2-phenylacetyl-CoA epoxidase subunit PaaD
MHTRSDILSIRPPVDLQSGIPSSGFAPLARVRAILENVKDPEIPVLSIAELGILRDVEIAGETIIVTITPTYSGCPAMRVVEEDIERALFEAGYSSITIKTRLSPAWTTDWMTPFAREKLQSFGIAPPCKSADAAKAPCCPHCESGDVREISAFGSTACKALFQCQHCAEPFDYFKPY